MSRSVIHSKRSKKPAPSAQIRKDTVGKVYAALEKNSGTENPGKGKVERGHDPNDYPKLKK